MICSSSIWFHQQQHVRRVGAGALTRLPSPIRQGGDGEGGGGPNDDQAPVGCSLVWFGIANGDGGVMGHDFFFGERYVELYERKSEYRSDCGKK